MHGIEGGRGFGQASPFPLKNKFQRRHLEYVTSRHFPRFHSWHLKNILPAVCLHMTVKSCLICYVQWRCIWRHPDDMLRQCKRTCFIAVDDVTRLLWCSTPQIEHGVAAKWCYIVSVRSPAYNIQSLKSYANYFVYSMEDFRILTLHWHRLYIPHIACQSCQVPEAYVGQL